MNLSKDQLLLIYEALAGAYVELAAIEEVSEDYVTAGHLMEQMEEAIATLEGWIDATP